LFPKKKNEMPVGNLRNLVEAFNTLEDPVLQLKRSFVRRGCRCSGYRGIPVHLLQGSFNGLASAQGWNNDQSPAEKTLMRRCLMRRTMAKTTKDQKTSS
jgi:hypothetical protein